MPNPSLPIQSIMEYRLHLVSAKIQSLRNHDHKNLLQSQSSARSDARFTIANFSTSFIFSNKCIVTSFNFSNKCIVTSFNLSNKRIVTSFILSNKRFDTLSNSHRKTFGTRRRPQSNELALSSQTLTPGCMYASPFQKNRFRMFLHVCICALFSRHLWFLESTFSWK